MGHLKIAAVLAAALRAAPFVLPLTAVVAAPSAEPAAAARTSAAPLPLIQEIVSGLQQAAVVSGHFEQHKVLSGFRNPVVSSGEFLVARERGIVWHTQMPFESRLSITRERISTQHAGGTEQTLLSADNAPALQTVNELLFAVMTADLQQLSEQFDISGMRLPDAHWTLELVPRTPLLLQWLSRVHLSGDDWVRKVELQETQGDRSVIHLSRHQAGSQVPDVFPAQ